MEKSLVSCICIQNRLQEERDEDAFVNVKRKMNIFVSAQKSQREHEKDTKLKAAIDSMKIISSVESHSSDENIIKRQ
jgi:DNA-binding transcriptional regulator YhcF (GntR family)